MHIYFKSHQHKMSIDSIPAWYKVCSSCLCHPSMSLTLETGRTRRLQVLKSRPVGSQRLFLENGACNCFQNLWLTEHFLLFQSASVQGSKLLNCYGNLEPSTWAWEVVPAVKGALFLQSTEVSWLTTTCNPSFRNLNSLPWLLVLTTLMCIAACRKIHKLKKQAINKGTELGRNVQMSIFVCFWARYLACSISPSPETSHIV